MKRERKKQVPFFALGKEKENLTFKRALLFEFDDLSEGSVWWSSLNWLFYLGVGVFFLEREREKRVENENSGHE